MLDSLPPVLIWRRDGEGKGVIGGKKIKEVVSRGLFSPFLMLMKGGMVFQLLACRVCLPCSMLRCLDIVGGQNSRPGIQ